jgi:hypothetical protein
MVTRRYATMRRCGQLNLNERGPLTLDVASWLDDWASLKLDVTAEKHAAQSRVVELRSRGQEE